MPSLFDRSMEGRALSGLILRKDNTTIFMELIGRESHTTFRSMRGVWILCIDAKDVIRKMMDGITECSFYIADHEGAVFIHVLSVSGKRQIFTFGRSYFKDVFLPSFDNWVFRYHKTHQPFVIDWRKEGF